MGRQEGLIKIKGQLGGISFYKTKDGYLARQKNGVSGDRIKTDPAFERIRENGAEFGRAGKAGKLLRTALRSLLINTSDHRMTSRLTRELVKVVQADAVNTRGKRNVMDGETELLTGFDFNLEATLASIMLVQTHMEIQRAAGTMRLTIPDFVPTIMLKAPQGATHFRIIAAGAEIDFEQGTSVVDMQNMNEYELSPTAVHIEPITCTVTAGSTSPLFLVMGIEFFQKVNDQLYPLKNGAHNALSLVKIDGGA